MATTAALILLFAGGGGAAPAAAGAPSVTPDMPPEVQSWRETILPREAYVDLAAQWRAYLAEHPESAVAYVELSRALRYAGTSTPEERSELIRTAYETDPNCPEALDAMAESFLGKTSLVESPEEAFALGKKAADLAPGWPAPHFNLWSLAIFLGDMEAADEQLQAILETGGIAAPVLDFGYNLLASAAPGGIIFTNGDNDTYPPLALQVARGIRPDVLVVNLSLLNLPEYAETVWEGLPAGRRPFTKTEIADMYGAWNQQEEGDRFSGVIVQGMVEKVRTGTWKGPVYFSVTVSPSVLDLYVDRLRLEGLLCRVAREPIPGASEEAPPVDTPRTLALFQDDFRLDSATDLAYDWQTGNSAARLVRNYIAILRLVATNEAEAGDLDDARYALREAISIAAFHGDTETTHKLATYWKELEPDNPEVDQWL